MEKLLSQSLILSLIRRQSDNNNNRIMRLRGPSRSRVRQTLKSRFVYSSFFFLETLGCMILKALSSFFSNSQTFGKICQRCQTRTPNFERTRNQRFFATYQEAGSREFATGFGSEKIFGNPGIPSGANTIAQCQKLNK